MPSGDAMVILKDSTMREGLDVPGVALDSDRKRALLCILAEARVPEAEIVAPGHFERDVSFARESGVKELPIKSSGLIYGNIPGWRERIGKAKGVLDRIDILMPLSELRPPFPAREKSSMIREAVAVAVDALGDAGAGFPHATQAERAFLLGMCGDAVRAGAKRITLYDTNGSCDPWAVSELVERVREATGIEICFHAHNDLGLATANSIAAFRAGAACLDVTVNGLGDRAGNASLEQVVLALHARGADHGVRLDRLKGLSQAVAAMTRVPVSKLAPIVGEFAFRHKSPAHLESPGLFEPFDPALVGASRSFSED